MIRPATAADIPALVAMGEAMHGESRYARYPWNARKVCGLMDWLLANDDGLLLVAEHGGEIVGGFLGMVADHWALDTRLATDFALYVKPDRRGGIAAARLGAAYRDWALSRGAPEPELGITTGVRETETARLYRSLGFLPAGQLFKYQGA